MPSSRPLKPYIKPSTNKLNLNINMHPETQHILKVLVDFLCENGFRRVRKQKQQNNQKEPNEGSKQMKGQKCSSNQQHHQVNKKSELACLGLQSMFRILEKLAKMQKTLEKEDKDTMMMRTTGPPLVLLDARLLEPTAIAHIFGLYSLNSSVLFFVVTNLSTTLSKTLNLPKCSSVTLHGKTTISICELICSHLEPIKFANCQKPTLFKKPSLMIPQGKGNKKRIRIKK